MTEADVIARLRAAGCVFAEDEARLLLREAADHRVLDSMVARRVSGEPLEYILGWAEFCGLNIALAPGVFVPRRRTGLLVELACAALEGRARPTVVDLCCGAGAIAAALVSRRGDADMSAVDLHAVDIDPAAVACAARNLGRHARVYEGDLYAPLPAGLAGTVDLVVANVPYVPTGAIETMPAEARLHEHRIALDGGSDGGAILRRVAAEAPRWLRPAGTLIVESSTAQAPAFAASFAAAGFAARVVEDESLGAVAVVGVLPRTTAPGEADRL